jgi:hypothetical protein
MLTDVSRQLGKAPTDHTRELLERIIAHNTL